MIHWRWLLRKRWWIRHSERVQGPPWKDSRNPVIRKNICILYSVIINDNIIKGYSGPWNSGKRAWSFIIYDNTVKWYSGQWNCRKKVWSGIIYGNIINGCSGPWNFYLWWYHKGVFWTMEFQKKGYRLLLTTIIPYGNILDPRLSPCGFKQSVKGYPWNTILRFKQSVPRVF